MTSETEAFNDRFMKAVDFHQRGLFDHAIEEYQQVLELEPGNHDVLVNLGALFLQKGLADKAIRLLGEVLEDNPDHSLALFNIGKAYLYRDNARTAPTSSRGARGVASPSALERTRSKTSPKRATITAKTAMMAPSHIAHNDGPMSIHKPAPRPNPTAVARVSQSAWRCRASHRTAG